MTGDEFLILCTNTGYITQVLRSMMLLMQSKVDMLQQNALESYLLDYATQSTDGDDKQAADTGVLETDANGIASKDKLN